MTAPNNPLPGVSPTVVSSIRQASRATSIDFGALMAQAKQESGFRVDAKASGSSATGLFQFINSTWLSLVQRFGETYGVGDLAQQITIDSTGRATVADPVMRERILALRKDASLSAALAGEYARANKGAIERALGRPAGNAELYLAHFLGPTGATALLKAVTQNGDAVGAALLPGAAAANHAVFFDAAGRPRSVAEIYRSFAQRIDAEAQRFSAADADAAGTSAAAADVPAFISELGFHGQQLSRPMVAMLNAFALSALQLLANPKPAALSGPTRRGV
jgi:transglycosylase-like protein with SLT domain